MDGLDRIDSLDGIGDSTRVAESNLSPPSNLSN